MSWGVRNSAVSIRADRLIAAVLIAAALVFTPVLVSAQTPAETPAKDPFGEEITLEGKPIIFIAGGASWDEAFPRLKEKFKALQEFAKAQNLKVAGPALAIYTSVNNNGFEYQVALPLAEAPTNLPRGAVTAGQSPVGKALKFVHRGSYDAMEPLYEAIRNHLDEKHVDAAGLFVEEYVTDPLATPEDQLQINIFVLVK